MATDEKTKPTRSARAGGVVSDVRLRLAQVIRIVFTVIALILAVAALIVALRQNVNGDNALVKAITDVADFFDGPFSRENGIFTFSGKHAIAKDALVNWGIAAVVYLVVGRILTRVVRP